MNKQQLNAKRLRYTIRRIVKQEDQLLHIDRINAAHAVDNQKALTEYYVGDTVHVTGHASGTKKRVLHKNGEDYFVSIDKQTVYVKHVGSGVFHTL